MNTLLSLNHLYVTVLARLILAAVFLSAGLRKLPDRRHFFFVVLAFRVLPRSLARVYAFSLPWLEVVMGLMLLLGAMSQLAASVGVLLLVSFTTAIGLNVARERTNLDCGCFGSQKRGRIGATILVRNVILLVLAIDVALFASRQFALDGLLPLVISDKSRIMVNDGFIAVVIAGMIAFLGLPLLRHLGLSRQHGM